MVGIDLSKAFDCIPHELLLSKLKAYGLSENSVKFLASYLGNRFQRVKIGDACSTWLSLCKGVPQGSVRRSLLFNIFLNDLLLLPTNSNINSYADDTQLFLHGLNPITTQTTLQSDLTLVSDWLHADIIEKLNESILRFVFNDFKNSYEKLLQEINQPSLRARRINDMLILVF